MERNGRRRFIVVGVILTAVLVLLGGYCVVQRDRLAACVGKSEAEVRRVLGEPLEVREMAYAMPNYGASVAQIARARETTVARTLVYRLGTLDVNVDGVVIRME